MNRIEALEQAAMRGWSHPIAKRYPISTQETGCMVGGIGSDPLHIIWGTGPTYEAAFADADKRESAK